MRSRFDSKLAALLAGAFLLLSGMAGCVIAPVPEPEPEPEPQPQPEPEPEPQTFRFTTPTRSSTIALTLDGQRVIVANRESDSVSVIQVRDAGGADTFKKLAEIGVGDEPRYVAVTPDGKLALATNSASGTVSLISLSGSDAFSVVGEIPVGTEPRGCAVTPNGTLAFVANHTAGTVSKIDLATRTVTETIEVGGNPTAIAISNDNDDVDTDQSVFVTRFYAELIPGKSEAFDDGKQAFVNAFPIADSSALSTIALAPIADSGFTANRSSFCKLTNANAANDTFCPDATVADATAAVIAADPQGAFPNQLHAALLRGERLFLPNIGAAPEPPIKFNVNLQALVHVVDVVALAEATTETLNLNAQIKAETQPDASVANTVLDRLFGGDIVDVDADAAGENFLFVSRNNNYVLRASLGGDGKLTINAPDGVVRFQTGNIPTGVAMRPDGTRAYVNNELSMSVTAIDLSSNTVLARDIAASEPPVPGTFDHAALVGKLCFFTGLGIPENGIFDTPLRDFVPLSDRGKASDNGWSSCASCHPDGLSDGVTWIFATGPRNTVPLDSFFAKDNPGDQRISNWNAVRGSVTDFNENSVGVQGGKGFAGDPVNPNVYNHGITQGASDALDAQTLWIQTIRAPILPPPADEAGALLGRTVFENNCATCHGGAKWTKSQVVYADNPAFTSDPLNAAAPGVPRDPGVTNAGAQVRSYTVGADTLTFIENVGTFNAANAIEIRNNAVAALGGIGFNVPSLLGVAYHAPYFHDGSAQSLENVFNRHLLGADTIENTLSASDRADLLEFLKTIDGATEPMDSATDAFLEAIGG
ncbi:MAG: beta-propeller fold lactonase family protein [Phycisphaerae bacterium]|jgi:YVTN family beta-propeller protein